MNDLDHCWGFLKKNKLSFLNNKHFLKHFEMSKKMRVKIKIIK